MSRSSHTHRDLRPTRRIIVLILLGLFLLGVSAADITEADTLTVSSSSQLGWRLDAEMDTLIAGSYSGERAYVFARQPDTSWALQDVLESSSGWGDDTFGYSVALQGETVVVGAPDENGGGYHDTGAARVFTRSGDTWTESQTLTASDAAQNDDLGRSVDIYLDTIAVGAPNTAEGGAVYIYTWNGSSYDETQILTNPSMQYRDRFGESVAISGDTLAVGAYQYTDTASEQGAVYIFMRSGGTWSLHQTLTAHDATAADNLGWSVALWGGHLLVGAPTADGGRGAAYVFTSSGGNWNETQKLVPESPTHEYFFGYSVDLANDRAVVGMPQDWYSSLAGPGVAYTYTYELGAFYLDDTLSASDGATTDDFGVGVALNESSNSAEVYVGAFGYDTGSGSGAVYVFNAEGGGTSPYLFEDDFDGGALDTDKWFVDATGSAWAAVSGGQLTLQTGTDESIDIGAITHFVPQTTDTLIFESRNNTSDITTQSWGLHGFDTQAGDGYARFSTWGTWSFTLLAESTMGTNLDATSLGSVDITVPHTYRIEVDSGSEVRFYIDEQLVATHDNAPNTADILVPTFFVGHDVNTGVGGNLIADYVRVWEGEGGGGTPPEDCITVGAVDVCADDLAGSGSVYTASENIYLGDHLALDGSITANTNGGSISGSGDFTFVPAAGNPLELWAGDFFFDSGQTTAGKLKLKGSEGSVRFTELGGLPTQPGSAADFVLTIDMNQGLKIKGGKLQLPVPETVNFKLDKFKLKPDGSFGGGLVPKRMGLYSGLMVLDFDKLKFEARGVVGEGFLSLNTVIQNPAPFSGLILDADGLHTDPSSDLDAVFLGGVKAKYGVVKVKLGDAKFVMTDRRTGQGSAKEAALHLAEAKVKLAEDLLDFSDEGVGVGIEDLYVFADGIALDAFSATFPPIGVKGLRLKGVTVAMEYRDGSYERGAGHAVSFDGAAEFGLLMGKPNSELAFVGGFGVFTRKSDGSRFWDSAKIGASGLDVPLAHPPGLYFTGLDVEVDLSEDNPSSEGTGSFAYKLSVKDLLDLPDIDDPIFKKLLDLRVLSGTISILIDLDGWGELRGAMTLLEHFDVGEAAVSVNKPEASENGVRLEGKLDLWLYSGQGWIVGRLTAPYVEGFSEGTLHIPKEMMPWWMQALVSDDVTLGATQVYIGPIEAIDSYGGAANFSIGTLRGSAIAGQDGTWQFSQGWHDIPGAMQHTPHVAAVQRNAALPARLAARFDGPLAQDSTLITLNGGTESVIFTLEADTALYPDMSFHLIDPAGRTIDAGTVSQFEDVIYGSTAQGMVYLVDQPDSGDWYFVVDGLAGGEVYTSSALIRDSAPRVALSSVSQTGDGSPVNIMWSGYDAEFDAEVALYYSAEPGVYAGTLITDGLDRGGGYTWTPDAPAGTYTVYAMIYDDENAPVFSAHSDPVTVVNSGPPPEPTGFNVKADETTARLTWNPVNAGDLSHYVVSYYTSNKPDVRYGSTAYSASAEVARPSLDHDIVFTVTAVDSSGSESSAAVTGLPANHIDDLTPPDVPTNLSMSLNGLDLVLDWDDTPDASSYEVAYGCDAPGALNGVGANEGVSPISTGSSTLTLTGLDAGCLAIASVSALDAAGNQSADTEVMTLLISDGVDSDTDNLPDDYELYHFGALNVSDGLGDFDEDLLVDVWELDLQTQPTVKDTDGDGVWDGDETGSQTDPLDPASVPSLRITTAMLPSLVAGHDYFAQIETVGEASAWTVEQGTLPNGITLNAKGQLAGRPTLDEPTTVVIRAIAGDGSLSTKRYTFHPRYADNEIVLLTNGSFEDDVDGDKVPDGWKLKGTPKGEKLKTNKLDRPNGKPDKIFAYDGSTAFQFKAKANENSKLKQSFDVSQLAAGDRLTLSAMLRGKKLSDGAKLMLKLVYTDPAQDKEKIVVPIGAGTYDYVSVQRQVTLDGGLTKGVVMVKFKDKQGAGKLYVDGVSLKAITPASQAAMVAQVMSAAQPSTDTLPLPDEAPPGFRR